MIPRLEVRISNGVERKSPYGMIQLMTAEIMEYFTKGLQHIILKYINTKTLSLSCFTVKLTVSFPTNANFSYTQGWNQKHC